MISMHKLLVYIQELEKELEKRRLDGEKEDGIANEETEKRRVEEEIVRSPSLFGERRLAQGHEAHELYCQGSHSGMSASPKDLREDRTEMEECVLAENQRAVDDAAKADEVIYLDSREEKRKNEEEKNRVAEIRKNSEGGEQAKRDVFEWVGMIQRRVRKEQKAIRKVERERRGGLKKGCGGARTKGERRPSIQCGRYNANRKEQDVDH